MPERIRVIASGAHAPRRPATSASVAALLVAVVAGGLIGRLTVPSHTPSSSARISVVPGPSRTVAGVPLGFPHSVQGAVAALTAYNAVLGDPRTLFDARRRAQVLGLLATPRYAASFGGPVAAQLDAAGRAAPAVFFDAPIAYRVLGYDGASATLSGWGVSVAGGPTASPQASWATSVTTARWIGGDWKVDAVRTTAGPTPAAADGERPATGAAFVAALRFARGLHHVP